MFPAFAIGSIYFSLATVLNVFQPCCCLCVYPPSTPVTVASFPALALVVSFPALGASRLFPANCAGCVFFNI